MSVFATVCEFKQVKWKRKLNLPLTEFLEVGHIRHTGLVDIVMSAAEEQGVEAKTFVVRDDGMIEITLRHPRILRITKDVEPEKIMRMLARLGLRSARIYELLAFALQPDFQFFYALYAFGSAFTVTVKPGFSRVNTPNLLLAKTLRDVIKRESYIQSADRAVIEHIRSGRDIGADILTRHTTKGVHLIAVDA